MKIKEGDFIKITTDKNTDNIYRVITYEPEFKNSYGVRNINTGEFRTPFTKYIIKLKDYELASIKYNL